MQVPNKFARIVSICNRVTTFYYAFQHIEPRQALQSRVTRMLGTGYEVLLGAHRTSSPKTKSMLAFEYKWFKLLNQEDPKDH